MRKSIILAAGKGTRMKSDLPKVAHKVCGREMINRVLDSTKGAKIDEDIVVLGYKSEIVKEIIDREVKYVYQNEQLGTAHAVKMAIDNINDEDTVLILFGDVPLLKSSTLENMLETTEKSDVGITICTTILEDGGKYGRIIRDKDGNVLSILEAKDIKTEEERNIKEINVGNMCFKGKILKECLKEINNDNLSKEYYIVDAVKICVKKGIKIAAYIMEDFQEGLGANTPEDLLKLEEVYNKINQ